MRISNRSNVPAIAYASVRALFRIARNTSSISIGTIVHCIGSAYTIDGTHRSIIVRITNGTLYGIATKTTCVNFNVRYRRMYKTDTSSHRVAIVKFGRSSISRQNANIHRLSLIAIYLCFDKKVLNGSTFYIAKQSHIDCRSRARSPNGMIATIEHATKTRVSVATNGSPDFRSQINIVRQLEIGVAITGAAVHLVGQVGELRTRSNKVRGGLRATATAKTARHTAVPLVRTGLCTHRHAHRHHKRQQASVCI